MSKEPDADHRFREVVEAYEVLSNSERRELYDRFGHAGLRAAASSRPPSTSATSRICSPRSSATTSSAGEGVGELRGADIAARIEIDLAEVATGTKREVPFGIAVPCKRCGGNGAEPETEIRTCPTCGGNGRVRQVSRSVFGEFVRAGTCPTCNGSGQLIEHACEECHGAGRVLEERNLEVDIPAGIHNGQRIRLSGEGHSGTPGARAGDAYIEVHVRHDDRFVREATTSTPPST